MQTEKLDTVVQNDSERKTKRREVYAREIYEVEKEKAFNSMDKNLAGWRKNKKLVNRIKHSAYQTAKNKVASYNLANELDLPAQDVMNYVAHMRAYMHCSTDVAFDAVRRRAVIDSELLKTVIMHKEKEEQ